VPAPSRALPPRVRPTDRSFLVAVNRVRPNPRRVGVRAADRALDELADSLREWGQLQPVVVRQVDASGDYEIVCGERRWLAHQRAGLDMVWVVEWEASDQDALALSLVENLQRVNLSRAEKVAALDQLAELSNARGLRRVARQLRVDPSWLSRQLAVRRDPHVFRAFEAGEISVGQAAELLRAPAHTREFLLRRVTRSTEHVPVATLRGWVEEARTSASKSTASPGEAGDVRYRRLLDELKHLAPPTTPDEQAVVVELLQTVQGLLKCCSSSAPRRAPEPAVSEWIELSCLMCGERSRAEQCGNRLVLTASNSVRAAAGRLVCGRCGGAVAPCERSRYYRY
jgi:ParB/RepB/Spo0J family partition protein